MRLAWSVCARSRDVSPILVPGNLLQEFCYLLFCSAAHPRHAKGEGAERGREESGGNRCRVVSFIVLMQFGGAWHVVCGVALAECFEFFLFSLREI